jgi:hypothetical protein
VGGTLDWSAEPAVSMIPILATRHAVRGMICCPGQGVNAGIERVGGVDDTELSTQQ